MFSFLDKIITKTLSIITGVIITLGLVSPSAVPPKLPVDSQTKIGTEQKEINKSESKNLEQQESKEKLSKTLKSEQKTQKPEKVGSQSQSTNIERPLIQNQPSQAATSQATNPSVDLKINDSDGPIKVQYNNVPLKISWTSKNVDACDASWGIVRRPLTGSELLENPGTSKTYAITCSSRSGSVTDSVTINIEYTPSIDLKVNNNGGTIVVPYKSSVIIDWYSINTEFCSNNWDATRDTRGSKTINDLIATKTFTINCGGSFGTAFNSVTVNVIPFSAWWWDDSTNQLNFRAASTSPMTYTKEQIFDKNLVAIPPISTLINTELKNCYLDQDIKSIPNTITVSTVSKDSTIFKNFDIYYVIKIETPTLYSMDIIKALPITGKYPIDQVTPCLTKGLYYNTTVSTPIITN